jgi:5-methylcytosine-specific restriction endonuclease McrA
MSYKKYIQMATIALVGISLYLMIKRNPLQSKNLLLYANNMVKYMPIDKSSIDMISPIFDFTNKQSSFMRSLNNNDEDYDDEDINLFNNLSNSNSNSNNNSERRILESGKVNVFSNNNKTTKRSVSETKKKYVASMQDWKCGQCKSRLNAWFEVDHRIRLEHGGGNDVNNLVALCRECHGRKTAMENM